jgi:hypothetical protein
VYSTIAITIAVFALVAGGIQHKRGRTPKLVGWLFLIGGIGLAGSAGLLGDLLRKVGVILGRAVSIGTAKGFGVAVPAALVFGIALWIAHDLMPKNRTPSKALPWLALALPTLLAVTGGIWSGLGGEVLTALGDATSEFVNAFVGGL